MRTIEVTISPTGETRVETKGFTGSSCREAGQFLESAVGVKTSELLTAEYYTSQIPHTNTLNQET